MARKPASTPISGRDEKGRFRKGVSGNPAGRQREDVHVKELARKFTREALDTLVEIMRTGPAKERRQAAEALLDRAWGRPAQAITGEDGGALEIRFVTQVPRPGGDGS